MLTKIIIVLFMAAILYTLGSSFYYLVTDKGQSDRTVKRLSWRIGLSLLLVLLLWGGFKLGLIEPQGVDPVNYQAPREQGGDDSGG